MSLVEESCEVIVSDRKCGRPAFDTIQISPNGVTRGICVEHQAELEAGSVMRFYDEYGYHALMQWWDRSKL